MSSLSFCMCSQAKAGQTVIPLCEGGEAPYLNWIYTFSSLHLTKKIQSRASGKAECQSSREMAWGVSLESDGNADMQRV